MSRTSQTMLDRLASRTLRVYERHKDDAPALSAFEGRLPPATMSYIVARRAVRSFAPKQSRELREGKVSISTLLGSFRTWKGIVQNDVPEYDGREFGQNPEVPDDVLNDVQAFLDLVTDHEAEHGALEYGDALRGELEPLLEKARTEWAEAGGARAEWTARLTEARRTAQEFHTLLVAFRKTLRATIGRAHPDYQKLRLARASTPDEEDAEVLDLGPAPETETSSTGENDESEAHAEAS